MADPTKNKRFFYINSFNRLSGTSSAFSVAIQMPAHEEYDACCVTQASIPISYYLVASGYNTFILTEFNTNVTITIPVGNYNINSFCTVVPILLNAASPNGWTYTMTYNSSFTQNNNGLITYTVSNNTSQPSFTFTNFLNEQFGFNFNSTVKFSSNSLISTNVVNFINEQIIYIHSDIVSNGSDDVLQEIYGANSQQLSVISYQCQDIVPYSKKFKGFTNQVMNIYLTDGHNVPINLNGADIQITLLCYRSNLFQNHINNFINITTNFMKYITEQIAGQTEAPQ